jgi:hypothetical protein
MLAQVGSDDDRCLSAARPAAEPQRSLALWVNAMIKTKSVWMSPGVSSTSKPTCGFSQYYTPPIHATCEIVDKVKKELSALRAQLE